MLVRINSYRGAFDIEATQLDALAQHMAGAVKADVIYGIVDAFEDGKFAYLRKAKPDGILAVDDDGNTAWHPGIQWEELYNIYNFDDSTRCGFTLRGT